MITIKLDADEQIASIDGDTIPVYEMERGEMISLPYELFDSAPLREGLFIRSMVTRTGDVQPVQLAFRKVNSGWNIWAEPFLGEDKEEFVLSYLGQMFRSLAFVAEYGDPELLNHLHRVARYTSFMAEKVLGWSCLEARRIEVAALVHDVGKTSIPRELLFKPAVFEKAERRFMEQHTERGFTIISELEKRYDEHSHWLSDPALFNYAKYIALHHHENWNGSGYPHNKAGEDIPLPARIVKIVDVIDALLSHRPYKIPWTWDNVAAQLRGQSGVEFDPELVNGLFEHEQEFLDEVNNPREMIL